MLGHEIVGRVASVGHGVTSVKPGDRVVTLLTSACGACERCQQGREHRCLHGTGIGHGSDGGWAEYVRVSAFSLVKVPASIKPGQAALLACPIGVAVAALRTRGRVLARETVLITGAGGGLGVHAVQIAQALGARVLAVTSSPEKEARLRALGQVEVIVSRTPDFHWEALALTDERGADVVMDNVGSAVVGACLESLAQFGRLLLVGEVGGEAAPLHPAQVIFKDAALLGVSGVNRSEVRAALRLVREGRVRPIAQTFALEDGPRVLSLLAERKLFGRAVLVP